MHVLGGGITLKNYFLALLKKRIILVERKMP